MTLTVEDVVTHYVLSSHPKNKAIVDIKEKKSGELRYIKIRHRLPKFYAVSLVDPVTFEAKAETQAKSASSRTKPIVLHSENKDTKDDVSVEFRETSRISFEWVFSWEGENYKWVRESRMSSILECKAIRKSGDICVAQYLPRILKDEYFGIFSLLGYNILRCRLTKSRELELAILMSLMTLLDKSNDGGWKKDQVSKGLVAQEDIFEDYKKKQTTAIGEDSVVSSIAYEDPIPKKAQQKKYRAELLNDQKLQLLFEKEVKRSQKQIQSDHRNHKPSISAGNSPAQSPKISPLPTPSSSSNFKRLTRQKSASALTYNTPSTSNDSSAQNSPTDSQHSSNGRLTKLFSSMKQGSTVTFADSPSTLSLEDRPIDKQMGYTVSQTMDAKHRANKHRSQGEREHHFNAHQLSLPVGYTAAQFTNDFGKLSIQSRKQENPPSLSSIHWNPEPYVQQQQQSQFRSANNSIRRPRMDDRRRMSATEYPVYAYHHPQHNYHNRYASNEYYIHPYQQANQFDYY